MSEIVRALDPRGLFNDVQRAPLSPRPETLEGKTVYIINSWPGETHGFTNVEKALDAYLREKYAGIRLEYRTRLIYSSDEPPLWAEMKQNADCFIYFAAPSCSTTACAVTWPARSIERAGIPGLTVIYRYLEEDALMSQEREGMRIRLAETEFPCTNISDADLSDLLHDIEDALLRPLSEEELEGGIYTPEQPPRFCAEGTEEELQEYFHENGMTDGLPIIIPTEERVAEMLKGTSHAPDEIVITQMAPEGRIVTVEKAAITAVMAGAKPEYLPVILAMIEIMGIDQKHHQTAKSTNAFSWMQVVNGPIRKEIGMNDSVCALGPGGRANAVIGRAHRLALINLGGSEVGVNLMGVQGNVSTYTFAFAENEESSPWEPYSTSRGYSKDESVLTILTGGWSHCGNYMLKPNLDEFYAAVKTFEMLHGVTILVSPLRAKELCEGEGCHTRKDIEEYFWNHITMSIGELKAIGIYDRLIVPDYKSGTHEWDPSVISLPDDAVIPVFPRSQVHVIVVGDPQGSNVVQGWSQCNPHSASIDHWR
ncbi:MAG: hypothetical protein J5483_01085 [Lachnospiraceae bacterium]|nr:hypothetical protein [Lachnospiraceae bacterium]